MTGQTMMATVRFCPQYLAESVEGSSPCRKLLAAFVLTALEDLQDQEHYAGARSWFLSGSSAPFSFLWSCEQLELDPARLFRTPKDCHV